MVSLASIFGLKIFDGLELKCSEMNKKIDRHGTSFGKIRQKINHKNLKCVKTLQFQSNSTQAPLTHDSCIQSNVYEMLCQSKKVTTKIK